MVRLKECIGIVIGIAITNVTMAIVLRNNLDKGIYPLEADSIGIPIFSGTISSGLLLFLMLPSVIIPQTRKLFIRIQIILLVIGGIFAVLNVFEWILPNHYLIAASYLIIVASSIWLIVRRKRKLTVVLT